MSFLTDVKTQFTSKPSLPTTLFTNRTIIITGSNTGLGKEAVRHFVSLNASRVIMAVRSIPKGQLAATEIETSTNRTGVISVWECDYGSYSSIQAFSHRVNQLDRVDALILNAGIATENFERLEGEESTIVVNVISTMLLAILLLPCLRSSARNWDIEPTISIVSSGAHAYTNFPERKCAGNVFDVLSDEKTARMSDRYPLSKLLQILLSRALAEKTTTPTSKTTTNLKPRITINTLNPGLCYTSLTRNATGLTYIAMKILKWTMAWTAEEGARTLVSAVDIGRESHGEFLNGGRVVGE
ncbi:MAG: hypothetical protein M1812_006371 [Candelaria pacifica]|nr:MAG: hypothetical protein M1812_006371 [Candelaria pacifica]